MKSFSTSQTRFISIPSFSRSGPTGIFWDIENCPIPSGSVVPEQVSTNILSALRSRPSNISSVTAFSAFGDLKELNAETIKGLQYSGVTLFYVSDNRRDAANKVIITDMFQFAFNNPPPCTIVLISGDGDFTPSVQILVEKGYTVMLVVWDKSSSAALCARSQYVWDWISMASGNGLVPPSNFSTRSGPPVPVLQPVTVSPVSVQVESEKLMGFKTDVLDLLYDNYPIEIGAFEKLYLKEYGKSLEYHEFEVSGMEELVEKVKDVVKIEFDKNNNKVLTPSFL